MHPKVARVTTQRTTKLPAYKVGDMVRVMMRIREGNRQRLQPFEGIVIQTRTGAHASFTVRRMAYGEGVEKVIPVNAPALDSVKVLKPATRVRRAQLGYVRRRSAKEIKQAIT